MYIGAIQWFSMTFVAVVTGTLALVITVLAVTGRLTLHERITGKQTLVVMIKAVTVLFM